MFGKLERTEAMNSEGIGMGLKICQRIVEKSGGQIRAFSEGENQGATLMFSMKMLEPSPEAIADFNIAKGKNSKHSNVMDED